MHESTVKCEYKARRAARYVLVNEDATLSQNVSIQQMQYVGQAPMELKVKPISSILKKLHGNIKVSYKESKVEEAKHNLLNDAAELEKLVEDGSTVRTSKAKLSVLQNKLLERDLDDFTGQFQKAKTFLQGRSQRITNLESINSIFSCINIVIQENQQSRDDKMKFILNEIATFCSKTSQKTSEIYMFRVTSKIDNIELLSKLELLIRRLYIRMCAKGYVKGVFGESDFKLVHPMFFNTAKMILDYEISPKVSDWATARHLQTQIEEVEQDTEPAAYMVLPSPFDPRIWTGIILGKPRSLLEGGVFFWLCLLKLYSNVQEYEL